MKPVSIKTFAELAETAKSYQLARKKYLEKKSKMQGFGFDLTDAAKPVLPGFEGLDFSWVGVGLKKRRGEQRSGT